MGWRIDENTSGSGKTGKGYTEFLLCKSLKCANERFFLRYFGAAKEKKICLLPETKRKFRATKKR